MIQHFDSCRSDYPEKPEGDAPRKIIDVDIDNGETVHQCSDCGAYEITVTKE